MDGSFDAVTAVFASLEPVAAPALAERLDHLRALEAALKGRAEEISRAVDADFGGRPRAETMVSEVGLALAHSAWTRRRLKGWLRPRAVALPLEFRPGRARVERVPLGRVAILGPWNYPVQLTLVPLVAALAGGNRVLLKPSELAPRTAELLGELLGVALPGPVRVVLGGPDVARAVTGLPLDGLFFTGSTATGRLVAEAAARNLVPVTLELGGKSPAIWLPGCDRVEAAASVMVGKLFSSGQSCVAPDFLMVPRGEMEAAVAALRAAAARLCPEPEAMAALLRAGARERLEAMVAGQRTVPLLDRMPEAPRMGPVAVLDPDPSSALMREEIFGPVLPVLPYDSVEAAAAFVNARPQPLALYAYGPGAEAVVAATRSGGAVIDDCLIHVAAHTLPFGGAGASGIGAYHGEEGFRAFTRPRSVMVASRWSLARLARPPYGARADRIIRLLLR